jgi:hypothetical protein
MRIPIDIRLNTSDEPRAMINGFDYSHSNYLLLEIRAGMPTRIVVKLQRGEKLTLRQRIALWIAGGK